MDSMVWSMLLLQIPSLRRKQGSLTTDSSESCLMMLFNLSVFRFWYISWFRSWRKWLTLGLEGLPGMPSPGLLALDMESSQPLARSRQQLQQSRPMGERQSSLDILKGQVKTKRRCPGRNLAGARISERVDRGRIKDKTETQFGLVPLLLGQEGRESRLSSSPERLPSRWATLPASIPELVLLWLSCV